MSLFATFVNKAPNRVFASILLGAMAGICYALLIPLILTALEVENGIFKVADSTAETVLSFEVANYSFAVLFVALCGFILLARTCSQIILVRVAMDTTTDLRIKIYHRIAKAPIVALENIGAAKMIASLTTDVPRIVAGARLLPDLLINVITLFGMLTYLLYLNTDVFWFVLQCIGFGVVTYKLPIWFGNGFIRRSRAYIDDLHRAIHGLINGAKELKLNRRKREVYFERELIAQEKRILKAEKTGHTIFRFAVNYGDLLAFFVIGAVGFVFVNYHEISNLELVGVIMVLLYLSGPIAILMNFLPQVAVSQTSMNKVNDLFAELPEEAVEVNDTSISRWQSMRFDNVSYQYGQDGNGFKIGPLNFAINRGEITFIVGGNGSGKSTLSKLVTQHYVPGSGQIYFDDCQINPETLDAARQCIGAIYSDYHLFDRVLDDDDDGTLAAKIQGYLVALNLDHKVTYEDGLFSTLNLSDGQKRRLALLVAYIEDKDLYLFDEWAADQDPVFKDIFYKDILVELKAQGKAVVVISHDDRYFDLADQLIVMNEGKMVKDVMANNHDLLDMYVTGRKGGLTGSAVEQVKTVELEAG